MLYFSQAERDKIFLLDERRHARIREHAKRVRKDLGNIEAEERAARAKRRAPKPKYKPPIKVVVSDRGERWPGGMVEAAKALGKRGRSSISMAIRDGSWCAGRRLWFEGESPRKPKWSGKIKPVLRVEDAAMFDSVAHVLRSFGDGSYSSGDHLALARAIDNRKAYRGFHYIHPSKQMLAYLATAAPTPQAGVA
jgi:hypothetical protein